jgi:cytochrome oxidase assembly protein ShyY1
MAEQDDGGGKVFSRTPKVGYYVISPLQMAQRRILVNRGWVSRTDLVKELLMEDKVEMEGLLRCGDTVRFNGR